MENKIGTRMLLKHLREAMAQPLEPQTRLNKIVGNIASTMQADVCSVYVLRTDDVLELFATHGLNVAAVHKAHLKLGQGLVGKIARHSRLLNIADAQTHPAFLYQPEVGEDDYHSFLGVPMKRLGQTIGVLIIRNKDSKIYKQEQIEALETAAMVLAELVASGDMKGLGESETAVNRTRSLSKKGRKLSPAIAIGKIALHDPQIVITRLFNENILEEKKRLAIAIKELRSSFDELLNERFSFEKQSGEHVDVLESLRMFAHDRGWVRRISKAIEDGLTAEAATEKIAQENRLRLKLSPNAYLQSPYLQNSLEDFDDLTRRLLRKLIGESTKDTQDKTKIVVVARSMSAAEIFDYDKEKLVGIVIEEATATSHVIIVARALGIAVVCVRDIVRHCQNDDAIIVDGIEGSIHIRPSDDIEQTYSNRLDIVAKQFARFHALKTKASTTKDGVNIKLLLNGGLDADIKQLEQTAADGIGLFRTELNFMLASSLPRLNEQIQFYKKILDEAQEKEITFRTLDIGGDKLLAYLPHEIENNPAMGWRAIRLSIDRPALLRIQLRALLRAAQGKVLKIKLPMISAVEEIDQARHLLNKEITAQKKFGYEAPRQIKLGAMIEVPCLLWQLDELMKKVDFVSVGSNDLFQFMTASDRSNSALANRYNPLSRPFMRALREIALAAQKNNCPLQLCGELAGEPLAAMALLGIGYRAISMAPGSIGPVKEMVRNINLQEITKLVNKALDDKKPKQTLYEVLSVYTNKMKFQFNT